jgi:hypothetical protein
MAERVALSAKGRVKELGIRDKEAKMTVFLFFHFPFFSSALQPLYYFSFFALLFLPFTLSPYFLLSFCLRSALRASLSASCFHHSHSIVPGGLELTSYTTRLTPRTSLIILFDTLFNSSAGSFAQSAVMPSLLVTALRTTACS